MADIVYNYHFQLRDGSEKRFDVQLDEKTLGVVQPAPAAPPAWTRLSCCQCPHCPLEESEQPHCPIAVNLVDLAEFFGDAPSYGEVDVQLATDERQYTKHTTVQQALSSLLGIYMVTSGCPIMDKLRPMVRFHLPFATREETMYRVVAMYLMAQYFRQRNDLEPDWEMENLALMYEDVTKVNRSFVDRLNQIATDDASANALIILDCFANYIVMAVDEGTLADIEVLFKAYLDERI